MRILFLAEMMNVGNASFRIRLRTAQLLAERGHDVTFVSPSPSSFSMRITKDCDRVRLIETLGVAPMAFRRGGFSFLDAVIKIWIAVSQRYDVIHVSCGHRPAQLLPALAAKILRGSVIVDEWWEWYGAGGRADSCGGWMQRLISWYDRLTEVPTKKLFHGVIAISSALRDRIPTHPRVVVLNGAAEAEVLRSYNMEEARLPLGLPMDLFIIGLPSVGAADHADNAPFLEAVAKLRLCHPELRLFVTGEAGYIKKLEDKDGLVDGIIGRSWLPYNQYNLYLSACNVFALPLLDIPRNRGRWPHKLGDFLLLNRPVITTPVGDIAPLFASYRLGILSDGTLSGYQAALTCVIGDVDRQHLCVDASKVTRTHLDQFNRVASIEHLYLSALEGAREPVH